MPDILTLDVRPILAAGDEPFGAIMEAADTLAEGQILRLVAPFRPAPLFRVMERRGYTFTETALDGGDWQVDFHRPAQPLSLGSALEAATWPEPVASLDLTGLEPPEPMVRLLSAVEAATPGDVVFAVLDREPVFLFPKLAERGHQWAGNPEAQGERYRLLVRRAQHV